MFVDESGFLLIPNVRRTWAPKGQTPCIRHRYRHDRLSVCSGLAMSPKRRRMALYLRCRAHNFTGLDIQAFLCRSDRLAVGSRADPSAAGGPGLLITHRRLDVHYFPAYEPELNPAEYVWAQADHELANGAPDDLRELRQRLTDATRRLRRSQDLLWSCIYASDLPWAR